MTIKTSIVDGQSGTEHGPELEACVKNTDNHEHALCINISGISAGVDLTTITAVSGNQVVGDNSRFSQDGLGVTYDMTVDGDPTPVDFKILPEAGRDIIVTQLIFQGIGGSFKMSKFMSQNSALTNGVQVSWKSDNIVNAMIPIKTTSDFEVFASIAGFNVTYEAGGDVFKATYALSPALVIRAQNTFGTGVGDDDYLQIRIQDDISDVNQLYGYMSGFYTEPGEF